MPGTEEEAPSSGHKPNFQNSLSVRLGKFQTSIESKPFYFLPLTYRPSSAVTWLKILDKILATFLFLLLPLDLIPFPFCQQSAFSFSVSSDAWPFNWQNNVGDRHLLEAFPLCSACVYILLCSCPLRLYSCTSHLLFFSCFLWVLYFLLMVRRGDSSE